MAATANWRCADCDTFNKPAEKSCAVCAGTRRASAPAAAVPPPRKAAPRPTAKRPSPARPPADWRCTKCDTNNGASDTVCIVCDTGWKAATKGAAKSAARPAAKKSPAKAASGGAARPTPKKPTPKKTTPPSSSAGTSGSAGPAARKATAKRPPPKRPASTGTARTTASPRGESLFHPPPAASTGYTPATPRTAPPPPPAPGPRRPAPPAPAKRGPRKNKGGGNCLGALVLGALLLFGGKSCIGVIESASTPDDSGSGPGATASCPERIADELPSGEGAELVEAFRTANKQITLCRTTAGELYYFGEFSDQREPGIAMPAERTSDGYEATNAPYRYDIHDGVVTIYQSGTRIGQEELTEEPTPE